MENFTPISLPIPAYFFPYLPDFNPVFTRIPIYLRA